MIATNRRPLGRACSMAALAIVACIILGTCIPRGAVFHQGEVAGSTVQDDYDAARSRLAGMLGKVQQVEGLVPQASIVPVVDSLNQALDYLELARIALGGGFTSQASANITLATNIMNAIAPVIDALVVQADATRRMNLFLTAAGIGLACAAAVLMLWVKRRHDKKKLSEFLDSKIEYPSSGGNEEAGEPTPD
jgi:hypothetical protein